MSRTYFFTLCKSETYINALKGKFHHITYRTVSIFVQYSYRAWNPWIRCWFGMVRYGTVLVRGRGFMGEPIMRFYAGLCTRNEFLLWVNPIGHHEVTTERWLAPSRQQQAAHQPGCMGFRGAEPALTVAKTHPSGNSIYSSFSTDSLIIIALHLMTAPYIPNKRCIYLCSSQNS